MTIFRATIVLSGIALLSCFGGCGWATPQSKSNSMTGVSESGYPKGQPADSGSPAIGSAQRPEKEKKPAEMK
jgi:hypothetical protein